MTGLEWIAIGRMVLGEIAKSERAKERDWAFVARAALAALNAAFEQAAEIAALRVNGQPLTSEQVAELHAEMDEKEAFFLQKAREYRDAIYRRRGLEPPAPT